MYPLWSNVLSAKSILGGRVALTVILMMQVVRLGDYGNQSIQNGKSCVAMIGGGHSYYKTRLTSSRHW